MNRISHSYSAWSVRHRGVILLTLVGITAGAIIGYVDPHFYGRLSSGEAKSATADTSVVGAKQFERPPENVEPLSLSRSDAVMVVEANDFFNAQAVSALRDVVTALEALPQVRSVLWMDRVPILNIFGLPQPLLPPGQASEQRFEAAAQKALEHPLIAGQLLSDDAGTLLLLIQYDPFHILSDADATTLLTETAQTAVAGVPDIDFKFRLTGRIPTTIAAVESHESNQLKYQLTGYGMIFLMTLVLFRGIRAVLIVSMAPALGVFWTLGYIRFLGLEDNPLVDVILPILVSLVGLTDGVHLMVQIRALRAAGADRLQATEQGLSMVGLACFLTSLTTAIGFGSLLLAESVWVRDFGLCSTIGVILCFVSVVTVIPLACNSWLGNRVHLGHGSSLIDRNLGRIDGLIGGVLRHHRLLSGLGILSTLILGGIALTLTPDQRQSDGLPQKAEATQALMHVDKAFGGLEFSRVDIAWQPSVEADSFEILDVVTDVDNLLAGEPLIGHPLSIRNLLDAQPGSGPSNERMSLLELLPPPLKRAFYTPELREAVVNFRVQDLGIAAYGPVFERIESGLLEIQAKHPSFSLELDGRAVWRWRNLYQVVVDLAASLGAASVIILLVLTVVYRSIRLGLISIVPNLFPLAVTAAFLVVVGYNLEIVMVCSFTICLGIAVDDTIHFLTRYREEAAGSADADQAIQRAFTGVGTALIMTTSVLVAGFSIVIFSDSRDHRIFAIMGALTISAALFCDLVFLPALLATFDKRKR